MNVEQATQQKPNPGTQAAAFEMLMNAVPNMLTPVIQQLVISDPNLVYFKGWHGMTPLHRACLIGYYDTILVLVQAKSDVNALTDFDQTPLHFASKRGLPNIVHLLLQYGASMDLRDKRGRGPLHYAAENGAIDVVRYFQDAFNLDLQMLDNSYQSAMHIACIHGHLDLFFYLMNTESSDLRQADVDGNLPIHITAKNGFGHMTWRQLCVLGTSVLRVPNKAGMTPVDLADQSDSEGHTELQPILEYYRRAPEGTPVTGPVYKWYGRLFMPASLYLGLIFISQVLSSHQYIVYGLSMAAAYMMFKNVGHRINDVSRWPEPFHAGFFYGGVCHTTLCYLWLVLPYAFSRLWVLVLTLTTIPALHYTYYKILTTEPGYMTSTARDPVTGKILTLVDICQMKKTPYRFCHLCNHIVPMETKHCKLCDHCFHRMDHHCLFLLRCVAHGNHALFVRLLLLSALNMALFCVAYYLYMVEIYTGQSWSDVVSDILHRQMWPSTLLVLCVMSFCWCCVVLLTQFEVVSTSRTTYFHKPPPGFKLRKLTRVELFVNFTHFVLQRPLPHNPFVAEDETGGDNLKDVIGSPGAFTV